MNHMPLAKGSFISSMCVLPLIRSPCEITLNCAPTKYKVEATQKYIFGQTHKYKDSHQPNVKYGQEPILSLELHRPTDESHPYERRRGFMCTCVCVCTCISTGVGVCTYSYGPDHPDMRIWGRDCADFQNLPRIRSHLNKQTKTHGYQCSRDLQKKDRGCHKIMKTKNPMKSKSGLLNGTQSTKWLLLRKMIIGGLK